MQLGQSVISSRTIRHVMLVCSLIVTTACQQNTALAQSQAAQTIDPDSIQIGIDGLYRVGRWTSITFPDPTGDPIDNDQTWSLETRDGDSTPVRFVSGSPDKTSSPDRTSDRRPDQNSADSDRVRRFIKCGSEAAPLTIRRNEDVCYDGRLPAIGRLSQRPTMIPDSKPWIVSIGDSLGLESLGVDVINKEPRVAVSKIQNAAMMPDQSIGWDGVDLVLIQSNCSPWIGDVSELQSTALLDWVRDGGKILMLLGDQSPKLFDTADWLENLLPFSPITTTSFDPSGLETFMSSQTPLQSYTGVRLPKDAGKILIRGRTTRRVSVPLASRFTVGFGQVTVLSANLDQQTFRDWPERMDLLLSMTDQISAAQTKKTNQNSTASYNDLSGQLRRLMDQYESATQMRFSVLSLIIIGLITFIGPLDYWLIARVLGRPLLGWLTFPITVAGLSVGLVGLSGIGSDVPIEKRVDILDIDLGQSNSETTSPSPVSRITAIGHLYSRDAIRLDATLKPADWLTGVGHDHSRATISALGYPGEAFGGVRLSSEDDRVGSYLVKLGNHSNAPQILNLPIPPRSSKSLVGQFSIDTSIDGHQQRGSGGVERRRGSELLQGSLTNPLDVDILDGRLIYQNWVYLLPTRFAAGATLPKLELLRQKNFRWLLSRQKALESSSQAEVWSTTRQSTERVVEMMLFHQAAGGQDYTSLEHRPLGHLDLSHVLGQDRCLLTGRLDAPICNLELTRATDQTQPPFDSEITRVVRILLPAKFADKD